MPVDPEEAAGPFVLFVGVPSSTRDHAEHARWPDGRICPERDERPDGRGDPPSSGPACYFVSVSFMPSAASLKATPWVVEVRLISTPFWFFNAAMAAPPPTVAPAAPAV